ncbi:MAG: hypothetical protein WCE62_07085 [Polyangiales bacterium]
MSAPKRERAGRWIAVLAASLVAHVVALSALSVRQDAQARAELNAIDISFSVLAPPEKTPSAASIEPAVDRPPLPTEPAPVAQRQSQLDPATAARAFVLSQPSGQPEAAEADRAAGGSNAEPSEYFEGVGDKTYLTQREPPKLQRHRDGTYHYRGLAFRAIVAEDGSVEFEDGSRQGSKIVFDLTDMVLRRHGEDPYRVEKRWFLESTEALREDLLEVWRAKLERRALLKLRGRLLRVFEDETLTAPQKVARIVAMFRDAADDDTGVAARTAIAEFVAQSMPDVNLPEIRPEGP